MIPSTNADHGNTIPSQALGASAQRALGILALVSELSERNTYDGYRSAVAAIVDAAASELKKGVDTVAL